MLLTFLVVREIKSICIEKCYIYCFKIVFSYLSYANERYKRSSTKKYSKRKSKNYDHIKLIARYTTTNNNSIYTTNLNANETNIIQKYNKSIYCGVIFKNHLTKTITCMSASDQWIEWKSVLQICYSTNYFCCFENKRERNNK